MERIATLFPRLVELHFLGGADVRERLDLEPLLDLPDLKCVYVPAGSAPVRGLDQLRGRQVQILEQMGGVPWKSRR
jgi:hypothetical protein